jgi:hypothetical protein
LDKDIDSPPTTGIEITSGRANITLDVDPDDGEGKKGIQAVWQFGSKTGERLLISVRVLVIINTGLADPIGNPVVFRECKSSCIDKGPGTDHKGAHEIYG